MVLAKKLHARIVPTMIILLVCFAVALGAAALVSAALPAATPTRPSAMATTLVSAWCGLCAEDSSALLFCPVALGKEMGGVKSDAG